MSTRHAVAAASAATAMALLAGAGIPFALLLGVASAVAVTDASDRRIPNELALLAGAASFVVWAAAGAPLLALMTAVACGALLWALWGAGLLGGGDVKFVPLLVLAAASVGDPLTAVLRAILLLTFLVGFATAWAAASGEREGPLAVGGPLALLLSVAI